MDSLAVLRSVQIRLGQFNLYQLHSAAGDICRISPKNIRNNRCDHRWLIFGKLVTKEIAQSNLRTSRVAIPNGTQSFNPICQVAPMCTPV